MRFQIESFCLIWEQVGLGSASAPSTLSPSPAVINLQMPAHFLTKNHFRLVNEIKNKIGRVLL